MTGSFMNNVMMDSKMPVPAVGMGATRLSYTDREPYTIIEIKSPTKIVVQADSYKRIDNLGMSEMQKYEYTADPNGKTETITKRKNGRWVIQGQDAKNGVAFILDHREKYHDFSF